MTSEGPSSQVWFWQGRGFFFRSGPDRHARPLSSEFVPYCGPPEIVIPNPLAPFASGSEDFFAPSAGYLFVT